MAFGGPRSYHERMAVDALRSARDALVNTGCAMSQVVKAARLVQSARSQIAAISPDSIKEGKRTKRMWGALGKLERRLTMTVQRCTFDR